MDGTQVTSNYGGQNSVNMPIANASPPAGDATGTGIGSIPQYQQYTGRTCYQQGLFQDAAVWKANLSGGEIRAMNTVLTVNNDALSDYNTGRMDELFQAYSGGSELISSTAGNYLWSKVTGLSGHQPGDAWTAGGNYYIQFGASDGVTGTVPSTLSTWTGGASSPNWSNAANWDIPAASGYSLTFSGTTNLSTNNDFPAHTPFIGLSFGASAGASRWPAIS